MTQVNLISLRKTYLKQTTPVLDNYSLTVNDGELVALLGPSGSGKSTLLKLIAGIEKPDVGDIHFNGTSIQHLPPNKRGAVFMFQKAYLFPFLSVADNIGFGLRVQGANRGVIQSEVRRMLDLIGLPGVENRRPAELSGGEQQRVALVRALVTNPKVLLLDEPLSSLDTTVRLNMQETIRRIQKNLGITTILVTHDLSEAMAMSDRMALLLDGNMVAEGKPETLFHRPPTLAAAQFMGVSTFIKGIQTAGCLESPLGMLEIPCRHNKSQHATYAIRSEHINLKKDPGINSLPGVVSDCVFRGEYIEYQVNLQGMMTVRARMPMPSPMYQTGEQVFVYLPQDKLFEIIN